MNLSESHIRQHEKKNHQEISFEEIEIVQNTPGLILKGQKLVSTILLTHYNISGT